MTDPVPTILPALKAVDEVRDIKRWLDSHPSRADRDRFWRVSEIYHLRRIFEAVSCAAAVGACARADTAAGGLRG